MSTKRDVRVNLQVSQPGIEGDAVNDGNGWPTPLVDPSNPLKMVVSNGSRGETRDFRAMATSRQDDISKPEGNSKVQGIGGPDELSIKVKTTEGNSL